MRFLLALILACGLQTIVQSQNLTGQVFLLANGFNETTCQAEAECDCCGTDLFFLSTEKFGLVIRCLSGDTYYKGSYTLKANKLTLNFDASIVNEITDEEYNMVKYETKQVKLTPSVFSVNLCRQKNRLVHSEADDWSYGSRYAAEDEKARLNKLLSSKAWKQLSK